MNATRYANSPAPTSVQAWNTSWKPKTRGHGSGRLRRVDQRPGRVDQPSRKHQRETDPAQAAHQLRRHDDGAPAHQHVGDGDDPLRRIEEHLAQRDPGRRADPYQCEDEHLGPSPQGQPGHSGARPGDADEDRAVVRPPHAPPRRRGPAQPVKGRAGAEHGQHAGDVDRQLGRRRRIRAGGDQEGPADQPGDEGAGVEPAP